MFPAGAQGRRNMVQDIVDGYAADGYGQTSLTGPELVAALQRAGVQMPAKTSGGVARKADKLSEDFAAQISNIPREGRTPDVVNSALKRSMDAAKFAAPALSFDQAMGQYRRLVIDMDGDGKPDVVVPVQASNSLVR